MSFEMSFSFERFLDAFGTEDVCTCCGVEITLGPGEAGRATAACECCSGAVLA